MATQSGSAPDLYFDDALELIESEQSILAAEADAFRAFLRHVEELSVSAPSTGGAPHLCSQSARKDPFRSVREAYQATVMDLAHYDEEYGESFEESVRMEYGPDIATLLTTGQVFERHHKQAVVVATEDLIDQRERLRDALLEERESIQRFRDPVESVVDGIASLDSAATTQETPKLLDSYRRRLSVLESRCHDLIDQRQSEIVDGRRALSLPITEPDIPSYLYTNLPVTYPVVAPLTGALESAVTLTATIETERSAQS
ncbi:hypothetical protein GRX03_12510 [Halovenus sp. WSH3]|uniref:DUF7260 domain-containing protein n=1 Tax=Halovenus carboxidivorans TaxID=2692199 RepID=A0A6B0TA10_9EURY|nr:hypothetical protein [Halovenus carboxidivorans]MXR52423.1 hypothetical protein [Halovenus carboxidivorans]